MDREQGKSVMYVGIDPGLTGGVFGFTDGGFIYYEPTPVIQVSSGKKKRQEYDISKMNDIVKRLSVDFRVFCAYEKVHAFPGQGVTSMFSFGTGFGIWQGLLVANEVSFELVTPRVWQKEILQGMDKSDPKSSAVQVAKRLFPGVDFTLANQGSRRTKAHQGIVDACCLAEFARRRAVRGMLGCDG